ncbi:MAG: hypothetical protein KJO60_16310 [Desulfofustis sp.]|nr:hypothetical protein [Desulfofustis sp.]MBT8356089.1 hypothetical protein [Desulfofustis sp.]NNK57150.1 hypothetical protein [Desulfofustis sp.]
MYPFTDMSPSGSSRKALASAFLVITLLAIPFGMVYYTSTDTYKARYQQWRKNNEQAAKPPQAKQSIDQFILSKDEKLDFKKISLEFKGVQEKAYHLNLYLLDFDRQQPFPVQVSKKDSKEPITFGGHQFKIVSGNDRFIKLKLVDSYQTP